MTDFKVGDRVRRIGDSYGYCRRGEEYTISKVDCSGYALEGIDGYYSKDKFELVSKMVYSAPQTHSTRIASPLPEDSAERKEYPLYSGLMRYFPAALAAVSHHSYKGNQKHNPGLPMQHARGKSGDHEDCILRHLMEGDYEGVAWRALALLQEKLEAEGAPVAPGATFDSVAK